MVRACTVVTQGFRCIGTDEDGSRVADFVDPLVGIDEHWRDVLEALRTDIEELPLEVGSSPMLALIVDTECP